MELFQFQLIEMLFNHRLQDKKLLGVFVVLKDQSHDWGEEGVDLHDLFKEFTVYLFFKWKPCRWLSSLFVNFDILKDLNWAFFDVVFQALHGFINTLKVAVELLCFFLTLNGWREGLE